MKPTALEADVLELFYREYSDLSFPNPQSIEIIDRINTGSGRRVILKAPTLLDTYSGYLDMRGHFIEMKGLDHGLMATICVDKGVIDELEFSVYGENLWNGEEGCWKII
ncbi:MAG: hypothetical protein RBT79_00605 [Chiayiivirga sp.]|uniref:Uncharacterized protein n=1 Tax=Denitratimonas tolerans TaxID=1338420 RepID=A0AAW9R1U7_9GAMM|nr:hypothetical protein [Chiayiivirga sp.]